jgi:hypothetical protein
MKLLLSEPRLAADADEIHGQLPAQAPEPTIRIGNGNTKARGHVLWRQQR